jgi:hypothetical protein
MRVMLWKELFVKQTSANEDAYSNWRVNDFKVKKKSLQDERDAQKALRETM